MAMTSLRLSKDKATRDRKMRQGRAYARFLKDQDWSMAKMAADRRMPVPDWSRLPQRLKQHIMEKYGGG